MYYYIIDLKLCIFYINLWFIHLNNKIMMSIILKVGDLQKN